MSPNLLFLNCKVHCDLVPRWFCIETECHIPCRCQMTLMMLPYLSHSPEWWQHFFVEACCSSHWLLCGALCWDGGWSRALCSSDLWGRRKHHRHGHRVNRFTKIEAVIVYNRAASWKTLKRLMKAGAAVLQLTLFKPRNKTSIQADITDVFNIPREWSEKKNNKKKTFL